MEFTGYFLLNILDLFSEGLNQVGTLIRTALNFTISPFDPTEGSGEISSHGKMPLLVPKPNGIGDILLIADLSVLRILLEILLILAANGLNLLLPLSGGYPDHLHFEIGGGGH